jgi:8-oxo-dGTP diphosphatase
MTDYVLIHCVSRARGDDVLLVRKDKPAWQQGKLNLPGGKIEEGESPIQAAVRELKEESGYAPLVPIRYMGAIQSGQSTIFCFKAVVEHVAPRPDENETQSIDWYRWHQVRVDDRLIPNLKIIIPLIQSGVTDWIIGDTYCGHEKPRHTIKISVNNKEVV